MKKLLGLSILFLLALSSCVSPPDYPIEPVIEFMSMTKDTISQPDTLRIQFSFTDGDGDLGFDEISDETCTDICGDSCFDINDLSLFLIDSRTNCLAPYRIPFIPEKGSSEAISGDITVVTNFVCCIDFSTGSACQPIDGMPLDSVQYRIKIKDRAGNFSNEITTPWLYIRCNE